ncbi:MAG: hypothetical protein K2K55_01735 [Duncaniella sp.]|nr:hypothetical protein [Duncaniella sp.]
MNRIRHAAVALAFASASIMTAQTQSDTLLNVSAAKEIMIFSDNKITSIQVSKLNNGADNFFYQTGEGKKKGAWSKSMIMCQNLTDVTVVETDSAVTVSYRSPENIDPVSLSFPYADPENRQQASYIGRKSNDVGFTLSRKGESRWSLFFGGLTAGWTGTVNRSPGFSPTVGKSWDLSILSILGVKYSYRAHTLIGGFGIGAQHIVTKGDSYLTKTEDGSLGLLPYAENQSKRSSTLELFRLQVPLLYSYSFGKGGDWSVSLGPVVNFNTGASIVNRYRMDGSKYTVKTGGLPRRIVTVDPMVSISYDGLGLYFRYSPMKQFKGETGVNFSTWSAGIVLLLN